MKNELVWVYGLFFADGHAYYNPIETYYQWHIDNTNEAYLQKAKDILGDDFRLYLPDSQREGEMAGDIQRKKNLYRLTTPKGYGERKPYAKKYDNLFYRKDRSKKVPREIMDSEAETILSFLKGVRAGDGTKYRKSSKERYLITLGSKRTLGQFKELFNKVGWKTVTREEERRNAWYIARERRVVSKKGRRITKECKECGCKFEVVPSMSDAKFCSRECYEEWWVRNIA